MAGLLAAAGAAGYAGGTVAGLGDDDPPAAAPAADGAPVVGNRRNERLLNIYNWSDYVDDRTIPLFQAQANIRVDYDVFSSNQDLLARMRAGPTSYDIIVPTNNFIPTYLKLGLIEPLNQELIPNLTNLDRGQEPQLHRGRRPGRGRQAGPVGPGETEGAHHRHLHRRAGGQRDLGRPGLERRHVPGPGPEPGRQLRHPQGGIAALRRRHGHPQGRPHPGNAARFMNYALHPKVQARISRYVSYGTPVSLAEPLLPSDQTEDPSIYPPASTKLSIVTLTGQKLQRWQAAYDQIVK